MRLITGPLRSRFFEGSALVRCTLRNWLADDSTTMGASLAFYCAFSLAPLLVIVLTTSGWIVGSTAAFAQLGSQLTALFGPSVAKVLLEAIKSSQQTQGIIATLVSVATLLVGATTVLAALQTALQVIWRVRVPTSNGIVAWVRTRFVSLAFILALGFLLLISLTLSTGLSSLRQRLGETHAAAVGVLAVIDIAVSVGLIGLLFALIFRYLPARKLRWGSVVVGGLVTATLFDSGRWAVSLYLAHSTQPSAFGAAASFATLILWLYYTSLIFLLGAEFTACLGGLRPESAAQRRTTPDGRLAMR